MSEDFIYGWALVGFVVLVTTISLVCSWWWKKFGAEAWYLESYESRPRNLAWFCICTVWDTGVWFLITLRCRWLGHDIVDEGYAGPEHGCIDLVCRRCGYSWRVDLY